MTPVIEIPIGTGPQTEETVEMAEGSATQGLATQAHEQNMSQLAQCGIIAQQNFITVGKAADYSYLQGKDMVSLTEALGAREVGSEKNPGGHEISDLENFLLPTAQEPRSLRPLLCQNRKAVVDALQGRGHLLFLFLEDPGSKLQVLPDRQFREDAPELWNIGHSG